MAGPSIHASLEPVSTSQVRSGVAWAYRGFAAANVRVALLDQGVFWNACQKKKKKKKKRDRPPPQGQESSFFSHYAHQPASSGFIGGAWRRHLKVPLMCRAAPQRLTCRLYPPGGMAGRVAAPRPVWPAGA